MRSASRTLSQLLMLTLAVGLSGCSWFNFFGDDDLPKPVEVPVEAPLQQKRPLPVY